VILLGVRAADLEAMRHRLDAPPMARFAEFDAVFHFVRDVRHLHSSWIAGFFAGDCRRAARSIHCTKGSAS
jgi:hypothetical protein